MITKFPALLGTTLACVVALASGDLATAADEPTQTVDAGGMTFKAPASWKTSKPSNTMRRAQLKAQPVKGDKDPAELVVFAFPGGAGGVDANVKRWQSQFQDKEGKPAKVESEKRKGKNTEVTFVEISGHYVAAVSPGSSEKLDKPDYHLLGAIVETSETAYFLKMVGPDKTMAEAKTAFKDLISSINVDKPK